MAGRPTKLTKELIEKAEKYLATCIDTPMETDKGSLSYVQVKLPTLEGFARYLGTHKDTVQDWCQDTHGNDDEELKALRTTFSVLVKDILNEQGERLINNGLGGLYAPKIAGMMLSKHGYVEKKETDISVVTTTDETRSKTNDILTNFIDNES